MEIPLYVRCVVSAFLFIVLLMALSMRGAGNDNGGESDLEYHRRTYSPYQPPEEKHKQYRVKNKGRLQ